MKVAITAQVRNGYLWECVERMGSQKALAEHLGVSQQQIGRWLNFKDVPNFWREGGRERWQSLEDKLLILCGLGLDEVFPPEIRTESFLRRERKVARIFEMHPERLAEILTERGAMPALLPAPDRLVAQQEAKDALNEALSTLTPREEKVIKMRFGLCEGGQEHTLEEVGQVYDVSRNRIRQIEVKALNKLRGRGRRHLVRRVDELMNI